LAFERLWLIFSLVVACFATVECFGWDGMFGRMMEMVTDEEVIQLEVSGSKKIHLEKLRSTRSSVSKFCVVASLFTRRSQDQIDSGVGWRLHL
jgi:hypothetical protein